MSANVVWNYADMRYKRTVAEDWIFWLYLTGISDKYQSTMRRDLRGSGGGGGHKTKTAHFW